MDRAAYEKLRSDIKERCKADLMALERVWKLSRNSARSFSNEATMPRRIKGLKTAVNNAIGDLLTERVESFTIDDVINCIRKRQPELAQTIRSNPSKRASLSNALKRLVDGKRLKLQSAGAGSQANRYEFPEESLAKFDEERFEGQNTNEEPVIRLGAPWSDRP